MTITNEKPDASQIVHVASIDQAYSIINEEGTYVLLFFNLKDNYGRRITESNYFAIDSTEGKKAVDDILKLFPNH